MLHLAGKASSRRRPVNSALGGRMPTLILSSNALAAHIGSLLKSDPIWLAPPANIAVRVDELRAAGYQVTVLLFEVLTPSDLERAFSSIQEHHPGQEIKVVPDEYFPQPLGNRTQ